MSESNQWMKVFVEEHTKKALITVDRSKTIERGTAYIIRPDEAPIWLGDWSDYDIVIMCSGPEMAKVLTKIIGDRNPEWTVVEDDA